MSKGNAQGLGYSPGNKSIKKTLYLPDQKDQLPTEIQFKGKIITKLNTQAHILPKSEEKYPQLGA